MEAREPSARAKCREGIKSMVPADLWTQNQRFYKELLNQIASHPLLSHPAIAGMQQGAFDLPTLKKIHLEFRYTFAQTFTDGLLQAMQQMSQVEHRFGSLGKISARFLLSFNLFDELGFRPGGPSATEYGGTPRNAHYVKFHETLAEMGISEAEAQAYVPGDAAVACRRLIEASYQDAISLLCVLAVEETIFEKFAGPWAQNMRAETKVNTTEGYHAIHVAHDGESVDDHHAEDLWYVFQMVVEPKHYDIIRQKTNECLESVLRFVNSLAGA